MHPDDEPLKSTNDAADGFEQDLKLVRFFGLDARPNTKGYVTHGVVRALVDKAQPDGDVEVSRTVYGELKRPGPGAPPGRVAVLGRSGRSWVASVDLIRAQKDQLAALIDQLPDAASEGSWLMANALAVDERALTARVDAATGADVMGDTWATPIKGHLACRVGDAQVALRPTWAAFSRDSPEQWTLTLTERSDPPPAADEPPAPLEVSITLGSAATVPAIYLDMPVSLLLDELDDGAWEQADPLWIRAGDAMLRLSGDTSGSWALDRSLRYSFTSETRLVDASAWFGMGVPERTRVLLLLDQSGEKEWVITRSEGQYASLRLKVRKPALVVVLPQACRDGRSLAAPQLPPDPTQFISELNLVSDRLSGLAQGRLKAVQVGEDVALEFTSGSGDGKHWTCYRRHAANWVNAPEVASNARPGPSAARVLLPHTAAGTCGFRTDREGLTPTGFSDEPAWQAEPLPGQPPRLTEWQNLYARFHVEPASRQVKLSEERWYDTPGVDTSNAEPKVLRDIYRRSGASEQSEVHPYTTYSGTRLATNASATAPEPSLSNGQEGWRWALHPQSMTPSQRLVGRRGWQGQDACSFDQQPKDSVAYLERHEGQPGSVGWVRLPNDALARRDGLADDATLATEQARVFSSTLSDRPDWGLALFDFKETLSASPGGSQYELTIGKRQELRKSVNAKPIGGVNRLVIASAEQVDVPGIELPGLGVRLASLQRLYIEIERRGGSFVVRRAMLGWRADSAFGCKRVSERLEVTELYQPQAGTQAVLELTRTVEFNGAVEFLQQSSDQQFNYSLMAYFWSSVVREEAAGFGTVRVMLDHRLEDVKHPVPVPDPNAKRYESFTSLHDAQIRRDRLALDSDVVLINAKARAADQVAPGSWAPNRRGLFALSVDIPDASRDLVEIRGFIRVRSRSAAPPKEFNVDLEDGYRDAFLGMAVLPDWRAMDTDLIPWFSDLSRRLRPERAGWLGRDPSDLSPPLLATEGSSAENTHPEVTAFLFRELAQCVRACTLVGHTSAPDAIPRWVPCPVAINQVTVVPESSPMARVWIFDDLPHMVAEWEPTPEVAPGEAAAAARVRAGAALARVGWTREAVLELPQAPDGVTWTPIDSPLLVREASLAWFGWPMSVGDAYPVDVQPLTQQVPQHRGRLGQAFSTQVAFKDDGRAGQPPFIPQFLPDTPQLAEALHGSVRSTSKPGAVGLSVPQLRAGAEQRFVSYEAMVGDNQRATAAVRTLGPLKFAEPATSNASLVSTHNGTVLCWDTRAHPEVIVVPVAVTGGWQAVTIDPTAHAIAAGATKARIRRFPSGMHVGNPETSRIAVIDEALDLQEGKVTLSMPPDSAWTTVVIEVFAAEASVGTVRLFEGSQTRLAGVFGPDGQLRAFGEEVRSFFASTDAAGLPRWQSRCEFLLSSQVKDKERCYVATVDLDGDVMIFTQSSVPSSES